MKKIITIAALVLSLAQPALAGDHRWGVDHNHHRHHRHGGVSTEGAIILGLGGLMLGAAINEQYRLRYAPPPVTYYYPPSPPPLYRECFTHEIRDYYGYVIGTRTVCR